MGPFSLLIVLSSSEGGPCLFIVKEDFKQLLYENEELSVEREDFYYEKENGGIVMRYGSYDHGGVCWLW
ncbi:MAG: hypothetical protein E7277_07145 [Lachnospiraceae bacterium]|nr:hypothetical protein [Lachnospiraceae bacterium]